MCSTVAVSVETAVHHIVDFRLPLGVSKIPEAKYVCCGALQWCAVWKESVAVMWYVYILRNKTFMNHTFYMYVCTT